MEIRLPGRQRPATTDAGVKLWFEDEVNPVVDVMEGLDELDGKAGIDEVADRAVDAGSIRTNVQGVLRNPVRNPSLVIEPGQDAVQEPAHRGSDEEHPQVTPDS